MGLTSWKEKRKRAKDKDKDKAKQGVVFPQWLEFDCGQLRCNKHFQLSHEEVWRRTVYLRRQKWLDYGQPDEETFFNRYDPLQREGHQGVCHHLKLEAAFTRQQQLAAEQSTRTGQWVAQYDPGGPSNAPPEDPFDDAFETDYEVSDEEPDTAKASKK